MSSAPGPAWLGIGAQRSGTTWLTNLLTQHPQVGLADGDEADKELHAFDAALVEGFSEEHARGYRERFAGEAGDGVRRGEFTPFYLRALWVPPLARRACPDDVVLLVLLRDPVDRFASAMRWYANRRLGRLPKPAPLTRHWVRQKGPDAQWGGMYADQLAAWARHFPREQIVVDQYERLRADPAAVLARMWAAVGLEPVTLTGTGERSRTATGGGWDWDAAPGLREELVATYRPGVEALADRWGVDPALWPHFT